MQRKAIFWLTILLLSNIPSIYYGLYLKYWWFDVAQHFLGGFLIAMLMTGYLKDHLLPGDKLKNALIIVASAAFIGVVWEFAEYIANQTLVEPFYRWFSIHVYFMGDLQDTVKDLMDDILGGIGFFIIYSLWSQRNKIQ